MSQTKAQLIDPVDGTIVNADINASAAIAGTKISPDFGSQAITTTNDSVTIGNSIIHSGDTDTKINFPAANTFTINTAGAERVRVDSSGKVGIGVTNPDRELDISNSSGNCTISLRSSDSHTTQLLFGDVSAELRGRVGYQSSDVLDFYTAASERMRIDSSGRVGIGLSNPTKVLHVTGTSSPEILLQPSDASPALFIGDSNRSSDGQHLAEFGARWNGTKVARIVMQAGDDTTNKDNGQLVFYTSATGTTSERLRINEGGDVGINKSAPAARLHVNGGGGLFVERSAGTSVAGFKQSGGTSMNIYFQNSGSTNHPSVGSNNQDMTFGTNNTERMRIHSSGFVSIGTVNENGALTVEATSQAIGSEGTLKLQANSNGADVGAGITFGNNIARRAAIIGKQSGSDAIAGYLAFGTRGSSGDIAERMRIDSSGRLLIGTTSTDDYDGFNSTLQVTGGTGDASSITVSRFSNNGSGANLVLAKSRTGTIGNNAVLQAGDNIGNIQFHGNDGSGFHDAAMIKVNVASGVGDNDMPADLIFSVNGGTTGVTEHMRIASSGNVGINTSSPDTKLHIVGPGTSNGSTINLVDAASSADSRHIKLTRSSVNAFIGIAGSLPNDPFFLSRTGGKDLTIDSSGNVFFSNMTQLTASGSNKGVVVEQSNNNGRINLHAKTGAGTAPGVLFYHSGNNVGAINYTASNVIYNTSSDYRLKENATPISDGITRLKTLKPYRFNFKVEPDKTVDGFFAHEVTAVPEAITGTKDEVSTEDNEEKGIKKGDPIYQGIDQSKLVPLLVAAVKELITKVETLEAA